jgi:PAS domain S-box-containing protein
MTQPPRHILLIEDSAEDRADLRQMLLCGGKRRYRFSEAQLGAQGVRQVLDRTHGPVDCVLLDFDLPDMDVPEVLAALSQGTDMPPCPVVVVTGTASESAFGLLSAGAQDYIGKSWISAGGLTRAVENAIERFALMTERRRAEAALRRSEERYRALFNSIDAGYSVMQMMFDEQGAAVDARYLEVNEAFSRQSGLTEVEGRTVLSLIPDLEPQWFESYGSVALTGVPVRFQRRSEGLQRWFDVYAFRLGEPAAREVAALFYDITERKQFEVALMTTKADAERANRAKSDFLLSMSHELRSPLSSMLGFAQLIEAGTPALTPSQQDSVQQILGAGWYLLGLINEILDLTAIESGKTVVASQAISLNDVLDDCQAMIEPQAQGADIELRFPSFEQACLVQADAIRTKQVLLNLLTNAIKYNRSPGRVDVRCTAAPGQPVRVSVEDTGHGLSAAQISQLFQPFNRLGQESGGEQGTGIGLVICKRLVEMMGGRVGVESTVGVGSCFWFELQAAMSPTKEAPVLPARTVLCIDADALRLQEVEVLVAGRPDLCLLRAYDIGHGIHIARSARPDVILLSVQLPEMNAAQAMLLLAQDPATTRIPVIALGADRLRRHGDASLPANLSGYLTQPLHSDAFGHALEQAFQRNQADGLHAPAEEIS